MGLSSAFSWMTCWRTAGDTDLSPTSIRIGSPGTMAGERRMKRMTVTPMKTGIICKKRLPIYANNAYRDSTGDCQ